MPYIIVVPLCTASLKRIVFYKAPLFSTKPLIPTTAVCSDWPTDPVHCDWPNTTARVGNVTPLTIIASFAVSERRSG